MRLYRQGARFTHLKVILSVALFLALVALFYFGFSNASSGVEGENLKMTQRALDRAVVNCYAVEGVVSRLFSTNRIAENKRRLVRTTNPIKG